MTKISWDDIMSDRDKENSKRIIKKELFGFGENPALLLVDFVYKSVGLKRQDIFESMKEWPMSCGLEGWDAVDQAVELLAAARKFNIPAIHFKGIETDIHHQTGSINISPEAYTQNRAVTSPLSLEMQKKGEEIIAEVKPLPEEVVIEKTSSSPFLGTPLLFHLISLSIDTLIVCGQSTSDGIRAAVVDGVTFRYKMGVAQDAVYDRTQALHVMTLHDMHRGNADVLDNQAIIKYFAEIAETKMAGSKTI